LFAHFLEIQAGGFKSLVEGQRVEFVVKQGTKGPQAAEICAAGQARIASNEPRPCAAASFSGVRSDAIFEPAAKRSAGRTAVDTAWAALVAVTFNGSDVRSHRGRLRHLQDNRFVLHPWRCLGEFQANDIS
jgi:hypothetical protein